MAAPQFLRPEQCVDVIIARMRKRIQILREINLDGYNIAIHELEVFVKQLDDARKYIVNISSKLPPR